jgi:hypothetical protein
MSIFTQAESCLAPAAQSAHLQTPAYYREVNRSAAY